MFQNDRIPTGGEGVGPDGSIVADMERAKEKGEEIQELL